MKNILKISALIVAITTLMISCKKYNTDVNGAENTALTNSASLSLNNRVLAGFVVDSSTLPTLPTGLLPMSYNNFRRFLSYDTTKRAGFLKDTVPVRKAGDVVTVLGYIKGDDFAISKRKINISFFKTPSTFITPLSLTVANVLQRAEDSYRSYQPGAQTSATAFSPAADTTFTLPTITATTTGAFKVVNAFSESMNGVNYNTYLVQLTFTIPAPYSGKFTSGSLYSINFNVGAPFGFTNPTESLGNVNWIYAFRIR